MQKKANRDLDTMSVAIIGSGLAAVGAIKALRNLGIRPTVFDWGEGLDQDSEKKVEALAATSPVAWTPSDRKWLNQNHTLRDGSSIPKKLVFGSDYFYGASRVEAPVKATGNVPPFSYALGGLSSGWGAAALPPQSCDLSDWPVGADELQRYCEIVLADLPYSAADDALSLNFPLSSRSAVPLQLSRASEKLLTALHKAKVLKEGETIFGQARLLVDAGTGSAGAGCRYCGQCMSGCVYGSIYKAAHDILALRDRGEIDYVPGCLVDGLAEEGEHVSVCYFDGNGELRRQAFDRVFVAAGAVNSARIVLNSLGEFNRKVQLKSRGGFVLPVFSLRRLPINWPHCNTQPGLFLELKGKGLEHWAHVQISTENELLMQKLGVSAETKGFVSRVKRFIAEHTFLLLVNYHSDHAGTYELSVAAAADPEIANPLYSVQRKSFPQAKVMWASAISLLKVFGRIGCLPLFPFAKLNSGAYHVGGTLPMRSEAVDSLETDTLGRIHAWKRVHIVDTSVFPSLPGTTIGLLAMANAYRIVDNIQWSKDIGASE
ncbi:GMC oxidoreductase [Pandoraea sp. SD6-2]|uniref:GMC oxidoreductase n=1 Tax=Pandoraea sp. SD6-2 TaxID=1286093 RepID=UPI000331339B|nr:GMC oxidoreductase [Pandoraea sp. SD6-2]EON13589.1 4Fe-4S binding protein [Pandoraea sp. SD6-2]